MAAVVLAEADVTMEAVPDQIESKLTQKLTVTCSAKVVNASQGMAGIMTLEIDHEGTTLATVFKNKVNKLSAFGGEANGHISDTEGSLSLMFSQVGLNSTGVYTCTAIGFTALGTTEQASATVNVTTHNPSNVTFINELVEIESQLADVTFSVNGLGRRWQHVDYNPLFVTSPAYNGSLYLLSRADMGHVYMAQFICFVQGGYLAEINSAAEFRNVRAFVKGQLNQTSDVIVWLGASDQRVESKWELMYNRGGAVYLEWGGFPSTGYDCLVLSSTTDFFMNDQRCGENGRVLCEVPSGSVSVYAGREG